MRVLAKAQLRPAPRDFRRNPFLCAVMTVALAATFWAGVIWFAQQLQY